ncbi:MAG TPA: tRNA pseudouridine(54/55) synthase Pus10 [Thermoplasmata archaeon]|nr:tRNA pseudouridine(54/55) synthase Pus10 [Thermoplasmata archaeon]
MATPPEAPTVFETPPEVLSVAEKALPLGLCRECFGRLVGRWGHGLTNPQRTTKLEAALGRLVPPVETCRLCRGTFGRLEMWTDRVVGAAVGLEWRRFSCGSRWDPELLAEEESVWTQIGSAWGECARGAFNRELGKSVEARSGAAGGPDRPDVVFVADLPLGRVEVTVMPLYLRGRYRKLDRTLPQTRWPCRSCSGRGCTKCGGTGKTYSESVEEIVAAPFLAATGGEGTRFHGMGREDIDARMLGRGRPFVLEVLRPRTRSIDIPSLAGTVGSASAGRVEVGEAVVAEAADVVRVKEASPEKSYRVVVRGESPLAKINEALTFVAGRAIAQRTPTRVAHRRADRVRTRRVVAAHVVEAEAGRFTLDLRAEAGTYIKEWVEGDGGRTDPNLAQLLGVPLSVESLDVLEIHDSEVA